MASPDTRQLQLQISASAELLIRNLKTADNAIAEFQRGTDARLASIDGRFAALGKLKGKLSDLDGSVGVGGLVGAATGATLIGLAQRGLDYASSLGEVSQQLGVTSRDLQVYRYAASQVGIEQETMEKGLAKLTLTLGKAELGAEKPTKAFEALGLSLDQLQGRTAGEVLPLIADGLAKINDPAKRAAIEVELFGKAGQQLDTLLSGGSGQIDELAAAAQRLGLVLSEDQIAHADAAADKLSEVKQVLEANIAGAVANSADSILLLADAMETLIVKAQGAASAYDGFLRIAAKDGAGAAFSSFLGDGSDQKLASTEKGYVQLKINQRNAAVRQYKFAKSDYYDPARVTELAQAAVDADKAARGAIAQYRSSQARSAAARTARRPETTAVPKILAGGGAGASRSPKGKSAEQQQREADAAAKRDRSDQRRANDLLSRAQVDLAGNRADAAGDPDERLRIEQQRVDLAKVGRDRDLEEQALDNRYIAANLDRLKSINAQSAEIDKQLLVQRRAQEIDQDTFDRRRSAQDDEIALAQISAGLSLIARDRHAIERRILAIRQQEERDALQRVIDDKNNRFTPAEKGQARDELGRLPARQAAEQAALARDQAGPLAQYRDQLISATGDMDRALSGVAANGLQNLEDGVLGVINGTQSLAGAFKNMAASIISDLARIAIQKAIVAAIGTAGTFFGIPLADGGPVLRLAGGGRVFGPGGPREDRVPAMLSPGEFVVNAAAYARNPELVEAINGGRLPRFADGGVVTAPRLPSFNGLAGFGSDGGRGSSILVRLALSDDLHATIANKARDVSVEVVRGAAPELVAASTNNTINELRRAGL